MALNEFDPQLNHSFERLSSESTSQLFQAFNDHNTFQRQPLKIYDLKYDSNTFLRKDNPLTGYVT